MAENADGAGEYDDEARVEAGKVSVGQLAEDIRGSVIKVDDLRSEIRICSRPASFSLQRDHVIKLCDAFLDRELTAESLSAVAFALLASDAFEWNDEEFGGRME